MIRLYHVPGTRSTRVLWLLEETGGSYDLELMAPDDRKMPEHLARHPLGRVPVMEEDGGFVFESAAICLHIADQHPDAGLIPPVGSHERGLVYQWTLFGMTELESRIVEARIEADKDPEQAAAARERFQAASRVVEDALEGQDYLVVGKFGVADVIVAGVLAFARRFEMLEDRPNIQAYLDRIEERPARQRSLAVKAD